MRSLSCIAILCATPAFAADLPESALDVHGQATYVRHYKPSFSAAYSGPHSLAPERTWSYPLTETLFFGARLGDATELAVLRDGRLNYATERILEVFYSLAVVKKASDTSASRTRDITATAARRTSSAFGSIQSCSGEEPRRASVARSEGRTM
jgi:hypothetical protein